MCLLYLVFVRYKKSICLIITFTKASTDLVLSIQKKALALTGLCIGGLQSVPKVGSGPEPASLKADRIP